MNYTVYRYLSKYFIGYILKIFFISAAIILLFDAIEVLRVSIKIPDFKLWQALFMALMKNYYYANKIWPFIILLATILTYRKLSIQFEIYALKSLGFSVFQLLFPITIIAFIVGLLHITILDSIGVYALKKYQDMEASNFKNKKSLVDFSGSGIWINKDYSDYDMIFHALRVSQESKLFHDVTFLFYAKKSNVFIKRIDADSAEIKDQQWILKQARIVTSSYNLSKKSSLKFDAGISFEDIMENVLAPEFLSFWQLYRFIQTDTDIGLLSNKHYLYFWQMLCIPIFFASITFLGYAFGVQKPRSENSNMKIVKAIFIQFLIYFFSDFISVLTISSSINTILGAVFPTMLSFVIGVCMLLHYEFN
jgi:lipopolysaccharide export system permease protein